MNVIESLIVIHKVYKHYKYSALNWAELKNVGIALKVNVRKPVNNKGTRWVAHHSRAAEVLRGNYSAHVTHMAHVVATVKGDRCERTTEIMGELQAPSIPMFLNFLNIYLLSNQPRIFKLIGIRAQYSTSS